MYYTGWPAKIGSNCVHRFNVWRNSEAGCMIHYTIKYLIISSCRIHFVDVCCLVFRSFTYTVSVVWFNINVFYYYKRVHRKRHLWTLGTHPIVVHATTSNRTYVLHRYSIYYYAMMNSLRTFQLQVMYMDNSFGRCVIRKRQVASTWLNFRSFYDCRKEKKATIKSTFSMATK